MKIYSESEYPQGSLQWLQLRSGLTTASELDALLTPKWKVKTGAGPHNYLCKKVAEWYIGGALPSFQSFAMEQGNVLESEALPWFSLEYNCEIRRVGFITTDDGRFGASPDALIADDCGLESKSPQAETQIRYLLAGEIPEEYLAQVHGSIYASGFPRWKFLSYRRGMPPLVITVERDETIQQQIHEALETFNAAFESAKARMTEINGGPPPRLKPYSRTMPTIKPITTELARDEPLCLQ